MKQYILILIALAAFFTACDDEHYARNPLIDVEPVVEITTNRVIIPHAHTLSEAFVINRYIHSSDVDRVVIKYEYFPNYNLDLRGDTCYILNCQGRPVSYYHTDGSLDSIGSAWQKVTGLYSNPHIVNMACTDTNVYTVSNVDQLVHLTDNPNVLYYYPNLQFKFTVSKVEEYGCFLDDYQIDINTEYHEIAGQNKELNVKLNTYKGLRYRPIHQLAFMDSVYYGPKEDQNAGKLYNGILNINVSNIKGYDGLNDDIRLTYSLLGEDSYKIEYKDIVEWWR